MRLITSDDIIESYSKLKQKGLSFLLSKFNIDPLERTKGTFDHWQNEGAYWWQIPAVRRRWNKLITGSESKVYEDYFAEKFLEGKSGLRLLSLGSGTCSHEFRFAKMGTLFSEVKCMDIAGNVLKKAEEQARNEGVENIFFQVADVNKTDLPKDHYDVVLFHSSLHHFKGVEILLVEKIKNALKPGGLILINEFVGANRLQFPSHQIAAINEALDHVPLSHRRRLKSKLIKRRITGPGLLRMLIADPSECVESEKILPVLRDHFRTLEEKPYGGSLLMMLFKDIAHHFMHEDPETFEILRRLFHAEDGYLRRGGSSDFIFGVYAR